MNKTKKLIIIAMIAALYAALTLGLAPLSFGNIQIRISEGLMVLSFIYAPAIWGLTLGCAIANFIGAILSYNVIGYYDILFGSLATLVSAYLAYKTNHIRIKDIPYLSLFWPVLLNGIIVGAELAYVIAPTAFLTSMVIFGLEVALGELLAVTIVGIPLLKYCEKHDIFKKLI